MGIDLAAIDAGAPDVAAFRALAGIGSRPYLLYVGRIDASKGALELVDAYRAYRRPSCRRTDARDAR